MPNISVPSATQYAPLPWHNDIAHRQLENGIPQSLMVIGRLGDGMQQLCLYLSQQILSRDDPEAEQLLESGNHPDLMPVERAEAPSGKQRSQIIIEQIRNLIEFAHLAPLRAHYRVAVITPACRMNSSAVNALLKLLEEPPARCVLILGCEQPGRLPATIRSRCQRLVATPPRLDDAIAWVKSKQIDNASELLELSGNAPLLAYEAQARLSSYKLLGRLCVAADTPADSLGDLEQLAPTDWLPWVINWAASGALLACSYQQVNIPETTMHIHQQHRPTTLAWLNLYQQVTHLLPLAEHPVNKRLLIEQVIWLFAKMIKDDR